MRTEYILTKMRPIKKLFIIEPDDYIAFEEIFTEIQNEIDIIQNLIFVNDNDLWSQSNKDFVKRSDPDIILNLSTLDDDKLSLHFGIFSIKPTTDHFKIGRFGTKLFSFTKSPSSLDKFLDLESSFHIVSASKLENTSESLFACLNFGLLQTKEKEHLASSIFKKITPFYLDNKKDMLGFIFENDKKFIQLTSAIGSFGGTGHGSSISEIDYNNEGLFNDGKKYFFISEKDNFKTVSYFWNIRSYYPSYKLAWVPVEFLEDLISLVDTNTVFVCFSKRIEEQIKETFPSSVIIQPSKLYFSGRNERWSFFEHQQTISITNNEVIIQHPHEKNFSEIGVFVLEVRGLTEFLYPKRRNIGKLFFPKGYEHELFAERFQRISELGFSKYIFEFSPLRPKDIAEVLVLPSFNEVLTHLFEDVGYTTKLTPKTSILEQTINLLGGIQDLNIIASRNIFNLLISLTPKVRTEQVATKLLAGVTNQITSENLLEIIGEIRDKGAVNFPSVTLTIEEILARITVPIKEKQKFLPVLQKLYDQRVLLRGKYFNCSFCQSKLWIQIDEINRINYCIECSNQINLPVYIKEKQASDYFRLNQLIVRAVDQGQLSTLLLLNLFFQQNYRAFNHQSNIEIYKNETLTTDIDLLIKIGRKIGIAECKSTGPHVGKQIDELIKIASALQCDFIAFSSLVDSNSQETHDLVEILNSKSLNIPAFIFTNEVLFKPNTQIIQRHFELGYSEDFPVGPIIIK